jgi:Domain of unknown function (DUF4214)
MPYKYEKTGTDDDGYDTYDYVWYPDEAVGDTTNGGTGTDTLVDQSASERFSDSDKATLLRASQETGLGTGLLNAAKELGSTAWNSIVKKYTNKDGTIDWGSIGKDALTMGATAHAFNQASQPNPKTGYQGGIPNYTALRQRTAEPGANYRPGQGGHQYFTGSIFANSAADQAGGQGLAALQKISDEQKAAVEAQNAKRAAAYTAAHPDYVSNDPNSDNFYGRVARTGLSGGNPAGDPYAQLYRDVLGREPDAAGLAYWKDRLGEYISPTEAGTFKQTAKDEIAANVARDTAAEQADAKAKADADAAAAAAKTKADADAAAKAKADADAAAAKTKITDGDSGTGGTGGTGGTDVTKTNPDQAYIDLYKSVLGRDPDAAGLAYWKSRFGDTVDPNEAAQFKKEAGIDELYHQTLGRTADQPGMEYWQKQFGDTVDPNEAAQFKSQAVGDELTNLYQQVLGRAPDAAGLDYWKSRFGDTLDPTEVAQFKQEAAPDEKAHLAEQAQAQQNTVANPNQAYIDMYQNVLGRAPDEAGMNWWKGQFGDTIDPNELAQFTKSAQAEKNSNTTTNPNLFGAKAVGMAHGGTTGHHGTYLQGSTDGMADKIPGTIDGIQPARLAHGEFVIPADVVSHLGNGNSDAGAQQLYKMMDRIRMARTGTKEQGKRIDPNKFMPGGLAHAAKYANGGTIRFATAGAVPEGTVGTEQNLSSWVGPYATDLLGKGQALVNENLTNPQFYQGQLTAGDSALQQQAYANAANLQTPASIGTAANTAGNVAARMGELSYGPNNITPYMSPYTQNVTDVVNREAQRNADIATTQRHAGAASAGAFGGSRQAISDAEADRNLAMLKSANTAKGLQDAYAAATNASQFGANYGLNTLQGVLGAAGTQGSLGATQNATGLSNLQAQLGAGAQQQATQQAGLTAEQAMFKEQKEDPFNMLKYQQSLLSGMPIQATSYNVTTDPWAAAAAALVGTQKMTG